MENIIFISNEDQLKLLFSLPKYQQIRISFKCTLCSKIETLYLRNMSLERGLVCRRKHKPNTIKFKCENCGKETEIRRFLFEHKTQKLCEHCTRINNAGGQEEFHKARIAVAKKICETQIKKYGAVGNGNPKANEKRMKTIKEKYGDDFYKNVFHQASLAKTPIEKHISNEKRRKTMLEKYGREFNTRSLYYKYNDIYFDSSWEVYFYVYCIDHSIKIEREPYGIKYTLKDGTIHKYYPDFKIPCGLVEIKSDYRMSKELEEKKICIKSNNVVLINNKRIQFFKNYFENTYGKHKIKELKCKQ